MSEHIIHAEPSADQRLIDDTLAAVRAKYGITITSAEITYVVQGHLRTWRAELRFLSKTVDLPMKSYFSQPSLGLLMARLEDSVKKMLRAEKIVAAEEMADADHA